jgi:hypothetical protein
MIVRSWVREIEQRHCGREEEEATVLREKKLWFWRENEREREIGVVKQS